MDLQVRGGKLVVALIPPRKLLKELLAAVKPEHLHEETNTGTPQGGEVW